MHAASFVQEPPGKLPKKQPFCVAGISVPDKTLEELHTYIAFGVSVLLLLIKWRSHSKVGTKAGQYQGSKQA